MKIVLALHGETLWNQAGRFQGHNNVELSHVGFRQAQEINVALNHLDPQTVYSSPQGKSVRTGEAIHQDGQKTVVPLADLKH